VPIDVALISGSLSFDVEEVTGPAGWTYSIDGVEIPILGVYTVRTIRTEDGQSAGQEIHIARAEERWRRFTDCGDPVA